MPDTDRVKQWSVTNNIDTGRIHEVLNALCASAPGRPKGYLRIREID